MKLDLRMQASLDLKTMLQHMIPLQTSLVSCLKYQLRGKDLNVEVQGMVPVHQMNNRWYLSTRYSNPWLSIDNIKLLR